MRSSTLKLLLIFLCVGFIPHAVYAGHSSTDTENIFTKGRCIIAETNGNYDDMTIEECMTYAFNSRDHSLGVPHCGWVEPLTEQINEDWWWIQIGQEIAGVNPDTSSYDCAYSHTTKATYNLWQYKWFFFEKRCLKPFKYSEEVKKCITYCPPEKPKFDNDLGKCVGTISEVEQCDAKAGNPIDITRGSKVQSFIDFTQHTALPLEFIRSYKSQRAEESVRKTNKKIKSTGWKTIYQPSSYTGPKVSFHEIAESDKQGHIQWRHNYQIALSEYKNGENVAIELADGKVRRFIFLGGGYVPYFRGADSLKKEATQWRYIAKSSKQYIFSLLGKLLKIEDANGKSLSFGYGANNKLSSVTNIHNEMLQYFYNTNDLLSEVTQPDGNSIIFKYDDSNNLISVIYPDSTPSDLTDNPTENYLYDNTYRLLNISDKKGIDYASWQYNEAGQAISSKHVGNADSVTVDYNPANKTSTVTNANGKTKIIKFKDNGRIDKVIGESCSTTGIQSEMTFEYDRYGRVIRKTDEKGTMEDIRYNTLGFISSKSKSFYTPNEQKTYFSYDSIYLKPTKTTYPNGLIETIVYGNAGRVESRSIASGSNSRTTYFSYNTVGLLSSVDGPRADVNDIYSYEYDSNNRLITITNPLSQTVHFDSYNTFGLATKITDENGTLTELIFDLNGQLIQSKQGTRITGYQYDVLGQVILISSNGINVNYEYNDARRLTAIEDSQGNRIEFTHDLMGNVTQKNIKGSDKAIKFTQKNTFDTINRLTKMTNGVSQSWSNEYDVSGNLIKRINPDNSDNETSFDALKRATKSLDQADSTTGFEYNKLNQLTKVTDALGRITSYEYNKFGELTKQTSPDSGITTFSYDEAGNLSTKKDARSITQSYTYDALNRLTNIAYSDSSENVSFSYDNPEAGRFGIGRLTQVTDETGSKNYYYNAFGEVTKEVSIIGAETSKTEYSYNQQSSVASITYPSGRIISYSYDGAGQISEVTSNFNGVTQILASNIQYLPFGPLKSLTYGNNKTLTQSFDLSYKLTQKQVSGLLDKSYGYNAIGNINQITDALDNQQNQTYQYDVVERLINADGKYGTLKYSYDAIGNRLDKTTNDVPDTYSYTGGKLMQTTAKTITYDANGNMLQRGSDVYSYNQAGRLTTASVTAGSYQYSYNSTGQRVTKQSTGLKLHFHYGLNGNVLAESDGAGNYDTEYVYLNGQRLALIHNKSVIQVDAEPTIKSDIYYLHTNHIDAPLALSNQTGELVWQVEMTPFGKTNVVLDTLSNKTITPRFPGQYSDEESGLYYNYFRDYDPELGRYIQSDPIGLAGGINTYGYVGGNPVNYVDPDGLKRTIIIRPPKPKTFDPLFPPGTWRPDTANSPSFDYGGFLTPNPAWGWLNSYMFNNDRNYSSNTPIERAANRGQYHNSCDEPPPTSGDSCQRARTKRDKAKQCIELRQAFSKKWYSSTMDAGHSQQISDKLNEIKIAEKILKRNNCGEDYDDCN